MARQKPRDDRQTSFLEELDRTLEQQSGKLLPLPLSTDDIGGALLAILSRGLYTNPLDCIREYVQNSVDAKARSVTIKITGNSVTIFDEGSGMSLPDLVQARQFGVSLKSISDFVGFRGIGIYSGFDLCRRLRITSTKEGDPNLHVLVFEFAEMKTRLEKDRNKKSDEEKTSLATLLSEHTYIKREAVNVPVNQHFTQVELQDLNDVHIRQLSDRVELRHYLLQNLPIDFDKDFEHGKAINDKLFANVHGYNAVQITLQSDGLSDEVVAKDAIPNLQTPSFGYVENAHGQKLAYYWACMSATRDRIQPPNKNGSSPSYDGFVYKMKGFTIGDRQKLRAKFLRKPQLYPWYTGEIYVLDDNVIPNAARNDFETNQAKAALDFLVGKLLEQFELDVEKYQARGVADERIAKYQGELQQVEEQVAGNTHRSDYETYARLNEMLRDLRRQKSKASGNNKVAADSLIRGAEKLQRQLAKEVENPEPEAKRRKRAAQNEQVTQRPNVPVVEPPPPTPPKTLTSILKDAGWSLEGDVGVLTQLLQESIADVLTIGSDVYRNLLNDFEARLVSSTGEE